MVVVVVVEPGRVSTAVDWGRGCKRGLMAGPVYLLKWSVSGGMECKGEGGGASVLWGVLEDGCSSRFGSGDGGEMVGSQLVSYAISLIL